jgi:hypothetical protein
VIEQLAAVFDELNSNPPQALAMVPALAGIQRELEKRLREGEDQATTLHQLDIVKVLFLAIRAMQEHPADLRLLNPALEELFKQTEPDVVKEEEEWFLCRC